MQAKREDLKDSFYLYIMRSSIGAGVRSQYSPNGHMPDRLAELLQELERKEGGGAQGQAAKEKHHPKPARKQARKR
jgi:hypothetical protein